MDYLRVLGDVTVLRSGEPLPLPQSRKTRALLAYLAITGRPHQRERLCEIFWDGPHNPKAELRWSLSKIRQMLGEGAAAYLKADRNTVQVVPGMLESDYATVRKLDRAELGTVDLGHLESAAEAFQGPFLADLSLPRCPDYEAWRTALAHECEVLRVRLLCALIQRLADAPERALRHAHTLQTLLPEDRNVAAQVEYLAEAARLGAARPPSAVSAVPDDVAKATLGMTSPAETRVMGTGTRAYATVYAAEIHGPPAHFEAMDPEVAEQELATLRQTIREVLERYGGTAVAEEMAELIAVFGAPLSFEDHAARACAAALEVQATVLSLTDGAVSVRAGLDSGEVILTAGHREGRFEVIGQPLRTARTLMRSLHRALPSATARVCNLTGARIQFSALQKRDLSGPPPDGPVFQINGENRALSRWALRARQGLSKLVGREHELMILDRISAKARAGHGQIVGIVGIPGVGKSRLTHEFLESAAEAGMAVLESAAVEFEALVPYRTVKKLLWSWLGLDEAADRTVMAARVADRLSVLAADRRLIDPLHFLLDLPESAEWSALEPYERAARIRDGIRLLVEHESNLRPVILLIEDMHWVDAESEAVFAGLFDSVVRHRILLLFTYRPEYSSRAFLGSAMQITVGVLAPNDTATFLDNLLGDDQSLDAVKQLLHDRAEGVPLFLEELVNDLVASGRIAGTRGCYRCVESPAALAVPSSVRAAIAARIDRLAPSARSVLQLAAVIGREMRETLLLRVSGLSSQDLAAQIRTLRAGEFIYEQRSFPSPIYAFKHALVHEVAYASMLLEARRQLHERVLRALEDDPTTLEEDVDALAEHALRAKAWESVLRYCVMAADRSVDRSAYAGAVRFLDGAAEAIGKLPPTRERLGLAVDVRTRMRPAYEATGRFEQALRRLDEAHRFAVELGDAKRQMHVLLHQSYLNSTHGRAEPAIFHAKELAALARFVGDERYVAEADMAWAQALAQRHEAAAIVRLLEPHREKYATSWRFERFGMLGTRAVFFFGHLSLAYAFVGRIKEAEALGREAVEAAEEVRRPVDRYAALFYSCHARLLARPDGALIAALSQGAEECRRTVPSPFYPWLLARLAQAQICLNHLDEASETLLRLDEAVALFEMGQFGTQAQALRAILRAQRRDADAVAALTAALAAARAAHDAWMESLLLRAEARLGGENAEEAARTALMIAESRGLAVEVAHGYALLADVLERTDSAQADKTRLRARDLYAGMSLDPEPALVTVGYDDPG